jgi:hypothetical protein
MYSTYMQNAVFTIASDKHRSPNEQNPGGGIPIYPNPNQSTHANVYRIEFQQNLFGANAIACGGQVRDRQIFNLTNKTQHQVPPTRRSISQTVIVILLQPPNLTCSG